MTNLGEKLRRIEAEQAAEKARILADAETRRENDEKKRKEEVRKFFVNTKTLIESAINDGNPSPTFTVPYYIETNGTFTIMNATHRDHSYFAEFQTCAQENGLRIAGECFNSGTISGFRFRVVSI